VPNSPALLAGAVAMIAVGSSVAVSGVLVDSPFWTAQALRYATACALLVLVARVFGYRLRAPRGVEWAWLGGVAISGLVLFNVGLVQGAAHAEPAVIGVAVACVPVALALGGGRRPAPTLLLGAAVVTAGAALVSGGGRTDAAGVGWAALVLACEVGFTLLAVPVLGRHGPWGVSVHTCGIAAVTFAGIGVVTEGPAAVTELRPEHLAAVGHLALVVTALAFVLWYGCVGRVGAGRAGLLTGFAPVAAAVVGVLLGGPVPGPAVWLGIAAVGAGLAIGLRPGRSAPVRSTSGARPVAAR
jgi:drug/metabolite transporter (DMT)-like permease